MSGYDAASVYLLASRTYSLHMEWMRMAEWAVNGKEAWQTDRCRSWHLHVYQCQIPCNAKRVHSSGQVYILVPERNCYSSSSGLVSLSSVVLHNE